MEHTTTKTGTENDNVLNDIIQINNDRIEGYEKAANHIKESEADLFNIFNAMAVQSRQFVSELRMQANQSTDVSDDETTVRGKIYRAWMDVKDKFSSNDRKAALESCEFGEDAALRAYDAALEEQDVTPGLRNVLQTQRSAIKESHDKIRDLRNKERE
jgi:uncharacterized protein (TIGR02284 family)